ncbi:hypothetical protein JXA34_02060 [Patescibacteria group bacterium]|nr:hypothetical protein [Patescibacteria group bacterium]
MKYPKHIYEPLRYNVASSIVAHEFKKIFGELTPAEYKKIESQIYDWPIHPEKYSITKEPRDFWNGIEGIMTGFRLKGVVRFITAENVVWTRENVNPTEFILCTDHFHINDEKIPTWNKHVKEVYGWLNEKGYIEAATKKVEKSFSKGIPRIQDPIYCRKNKRGEYLALDGNGRILHALLKNKISVPAFVGHMEDENPNNYWVPTMFLINLGKLYKKQVIDFDTYKKILDSIFKYSDSAKIEYEERVPDESDLKEKILKLA